ncbi:MAG: glycine oxidase ThiO [Proteobacteria bacterium]|nr:glycine oxidase ThiO [Pseudomonadota bacterium]
MSDFLIVGGGINGLLLARKLAAADADVVLLDQGRCGKEASWAGGGIISPLYPWRYQSAVTALASWAQEFYPQLVAELVEETGIDPELRRSGLLMLAAEDAAAARRWAVRNRYKMETIDAAAIYQAEPQLARGFESGLWMPDVANVRNPRLNQALVASLSSRPNVTIREQCQVIGFSSHGNRVSGIKVILNNERGELEADIVVVCAGAWSNKVLQFLGLSVEIEPVKGQMLLFKFEQQPIKSILLNQGRYLIPRIDGHLLAGSTLEHCGFDKTATETAKQSLLQSAYKLLPMLKQHEIVGQWAGLRPGAPQGIPYIGKLDNFENLYVNAGHYRNGLVLAPASARLLADCLLGNEPIIDPAPYLPANRH